MRSAAKSAMFDLAFALVAPLIVLNWLEEKLAGPEVERVFAFSKELLALVPTFVGVYLRMAFYWACCHDVAPFTAVNFGAMIAHRNTIIGPGAVIGSFSIIGCAVIGANVLIAPKVSILSGKYQHGRPAEREQWGRRDVRYEIVTIGENSFIGQGAIVLADVGRNATVGAGAVVNREVPDGITVMGNPARRVLIETIAPYDAPGRGGRPGSRGSADHEGREP